MKSYSKPYRSPEQLFGVLQGRGLKTLLSQEQALRVLGSINYFYLQRYKWNSEFYIEHLNLYDNQIDNHLERLLRRYFDDAALRQYVFSLINVIEDAIKNKLVDCFGSVSPEYYFSAPYSNIAILSSLGKLSNDPGINTKLSEKDYELPNMLQHFYDKYPEGIQDSQGSATYYPPVWKAVHCLTFKDYILMSKFHAADCTPIEDNIHNTLKSFFRVTKPHEYINRMDALRWLRNVCAHFDHIIGRSPRYYPKASNPKVDIGCGNMSFVDPKHYTTVSGDRLQLKNRCFAWYFQVVLMALEAIPLSQAQKDKINGILIKIKNLVSKTEYHSHLGFNFNLARFKI